MLLLQVLFFSFLHISGRFFLWLAPSAPLNCWVGWSVRRLGSLSLSGNHLEWLPRDVFQPMQRLKQVRRSVGCRRRDVNKTLELRFVGWNGNREPIRVAFRCFSMLFGWAPDSPGWTPAERGPREAECLGEPAERAACGDFQAPLAGAGGLEPEPRPALHGFEKRLTWA